MKNRASRRYIISFAVLSVLMIAFAFVHSSMNADRSSAESNEIEKLLGYLMSLVGFSPGDAHISVRKLAHFTEFAVIGALLCCTAHGISLNKTYRLAPHVLLVGLLAAVTDETIQLFSEGRASLVTDVWIDFAGVVTGTAAMLLLFFIINRIKKTRVEKANESKS